MISISHWGMFQRAEPRMLMCMGHKLADGTPVDWNFPGAIIEMVVLERGDPQPIYLQTSD